MRLGEFVRQKREHLGLSQEALGHAAGIGRNTVFNLESHAPIRIDNLRKVCQTVLKMDAAEWKQVLSLWLQELLGVDFDLYAVENIASTLHAEKVEHASGEEGRLLNQFRQLDKLARAEILKAIERPEMIENIRALNALYEMLRNS